MAVCVLWVTSYFVEMSLTHEGDGGRSLWARSHLGGMYFTLHRTSQTLTISVLRPGWHFDAYPAEEVVPLETAAGTTLRRWVPLGTFFDVFPMDTHVGVVPHWLVAVGCAIVSGVAFVVHRRAVRRARAGRCARCGYDLRATPERCSECGLVPEVQNGRKSGFEGAKSPLSFLIRPVGSLRKRWMRA